MKINIASRTDIANINPPDGAILISISSPDSNHPEVSKKWKAVLRQSFHDIEERWMETDVLFNEHQAKEILDLVERHKPSVLWVNCEAGVSRSAGVAVALDRIYNAMDSTHQYPYHNRHVAETILDVYQWQTGTKAP